jgi:ADP-ribosyl-[dinitrogen reductase] hydrolase
MGGLGRAGIVVAWLLTHHGFTSIEAIQRVREIRPGAIENNLQEDWVKMWSGKRL